MATGTTAPIGAPIWLATIGVYDPLLRGIRLDDGTALHKKVMSLFSGAFPEGSNTARHDGNILWRIDGGPRDTGKVLLVQATIPPTADIPTLAIPNGVPLLEAGRTIRFRLTVDAVHKFGSKIISGVPREDLPDWLSTRIGLTDIELTRSIDMQRRVRRDSGTFSFIATEVTGIGVITDPLQLQAAMQNGVGRSRAFGCGLLTLLPA